MIAVNVDCAEKIGECLVFPISDIPSVVKGKEMNKHHGFYVLIPQDIFYVLDNPAVEFYSASLEWIAAYAENPLPNTKAIIHLDYFNTSSSKTLWEILKALERIQLSGKSNVVLEWHYEKDEILEAYLNEVYLGQDGKRAVHGFGLVVAIELEEVVDAGLVVGGVGAVDLETLFFLGGGDHVRQHGLEFARLALGGGQLGNQ